MSPRTAVTPNDLVNLPPPDRGRHYELSQGELIVVGNAGARHERVKQRILELLILFSSTHPLGKVFSEALFTLSEETARIPDVSFLSNEKVARLPDDDLAIPFAPDLAIEVISHSEAADDAEAKVGEYLAAGVAEVWQVYPRERRVRVRTQGSIRDLEGEAVLETPVLPGFRATVDTFFRR